MGQWMHADRSCPFKWLLQSIKISFITNMNNCLLQSDWRHQIPMHSLPIPAHRQYPVDKDRGKTVQQIAVINLLLHRIHICVHEKPLIRNNSIGEQSGWRSMRGWVAWTYIDFFLEHIVKKTYYWWSGISEGVKTVNETLDQHFPAGAHHRN